MDIVPERRGWLGASCSRGALHHFLLRRAKANAAPFRGMCRSAFPRKGMDLESFRGAFRFEGRHFDTFRGAFRCGGTPQETFRSGFRREGMDLERLLGAFRLGGRHPDTFRRLSGLRERTSERSAMRSLRREWTWKGFFAGSGSGGGQKETVGRPVPPSRRRACRFLLLRGTEERVRERWCPSTDETGAALWFTRLLSPALSSTSWRRRSEEARQFLV